MGSDRSWLRFVRAYKEVIFVPFNQIDWDKGTLNFREITVGGLYSILSSMRRNITICQQYIENHEEIFPTRREFRRYTTAQMIEDDTTKAHILTGYAEDGLRELTGKIAAGLRAAASSKQRD